MTRRRSLGKDKPDFNQLRFHRDRHLGHTVSTEFYQQIPFFFTREGCNINNIGHYRGGSAFMICNGPSIVSGRYDLSLLKRPGVMTYGINNGPRTIRPNFWTCVDDPKRFLKSIWMDPCITKFVPHAHAEKHIFDNEKWEDSPTVVGECPNVYYFHRNDKFMADRFLFEDTVNWGNSGENGGGRSVMLPVIKILFLLGFRRVYLLGADFKMTENYTYHFDEQRAKGAVKCNMSTYDRLKSEYLPSLQPFFEAEGYEIYNCNPESELKCFPMVSFEDAIAEATSKLGDVDNERTWGMYSKPDERQNWKVEPDESHKAHLEHSRRNTPVFSDGKIIATKASDGQTNPPSITVENVNIPSKAITIDKSGRPMKFQDGEDEFIVDGSDPRDKQCDGEMNEEQQPTQITQTPKRSPIIPMAPPIIRPKMNPIAPVIPRPPVPPIQNVQRQVVVPSQKLQPIQRVIQPQQNFQPQQKIIKNIPCGGVSDVSSKFPKPPQRIMPPIQLKPNQHITIEDDGR